MIEHKKIYSNELLKDAIVGRVEYLNELTSDNYKITLDKLNNDMYELTLSKNDLQLFNCVNTIDCLYSLISGYYRGVYDSKE